MKIKPFASLVGLAMALTPVVMMALPSTQSAATARSTLIAQHEQIAAAPAARAVEDQAQETVEACRRVRVVAAGYGEPAGGRCATPRS